MMRFLCLAAMFFLCACARENPVEVERLAPQRESRTNPPCIEVICEVDSLGAVVRCDTLECK